MYGNNDRIFNRFIFKVKKKKTFFKCYRRQINYIFQILLFFVSFFLAILYIDYHLTASNKLDLYRVHWWINWLYLISSDKKWASLGKFNR
jgi:hypothetical protein